MQIDAEMNLHELAALIGHGAGLTLANTLRQLLTESLFTDTRQMSPEMWNFHVQFAETAILLDVHPRLTIEQLLQEIND